MKVQIRKEIVKKLEILVEHLSVEEENRAKTLINKLAATRCDFSEVCDLCRMETEILGRPGPRGNF